MGFFPVHKGLILDIYFKLYFPIVYLYSRVVQIPYATVNNTTFKIIYTSSHYILKLYCLYFHRLLFLWLGPESQGLGISSG